MNSRLTLLFVRQASTSCSFMQLFCTIKIKIPPVKAGGIEILL
jgi:hypothetical protein